MRSDQVFLFASPNIIAPVTTARVVGYEGDAPLQLPDIALGLRRAPALLSVIPDCLQQRGGAGYLWESPVSRAFRVGRPTSIGGGADEIMLMVIAPSMGTLPKP